MVLALIIEILTMNLEVFKMSTTLKIEATYKDGVLIPIEKVNLNEGERVEVEIRKKKGKVITLRGLWKGAKISEDDIEEVKQLWDAGIRKEIKILTEDNAK
ncbi:MAG TPA: DUF104 domain-containing protein [Candidatus Moranbacteria bacterium]|nr:DUF104 domain-containing protein [Candidatus Moranbacteria bacterium]